MSKTLIVLAFASIIAQIMFSFYYSGNIVNQNSQLDEYQSQYQQLSLDIADTQKQLTSITSINHYQESTPSANLWPNSKSINISNF
jgi:hypothetical protein